MSTNIIANVIAYK